AQVDYSAIDRNRLLWRARAEPGQLAFEGGQTIVLSYRYLFGIDAKSGALRWAYDHPRVELVAAEHAGAALFLCALDGRLVALDPQSGAPIWHAQLPGAVRVRGASFDADGFAPTRPASAGPPAPQLAETLLRIVRDRDQRFGAVKLFALGGLAQIGGVEVSRELTRLVTEEGVDSQIAARAGEALVARKDAGAVPLL